MNYIRVYHAIVRPGYNAAGESCTSGDANAYGSIQGTVYLDANNNGEYDGLLGVPLRSAATDGTLRNSLLDLELPFDQCQPV
ncbi:MAG: hypothetical protein R3E95_10715 [Thiolinea sp.]